MRIFCILLNYPARNYTLHPTFCLIIHLLVKRFWKVILSGESELKEEDYGCVSMHFFFFFNLLSEEEHELTFGIFCSKYI